MTRNEKLTALADVLKLAAAKARSLSAKPDGTPTRELSLATQIEGIAMEFEIMARGVAPPGADS